MDVKRAERQPLPSPILSSPSTTEAVLASPLPTPRLHPLRSGSQKEIAFINYVDLKILHINRRYAKKFSSDRDELDDEARGYHDFNEVVDDLEHVFDAIWVSGTPTLQIPYMLSLAGMLIDFLPAFPFVEGPTIRMVDKLDQAFAILLLRKSDLVDSAAVTKDENLVSVTDRVRIRSVIGSTRIIAIEAARNRSASADVQDVSEIFADTDDDSSTPADQHRQDRESLNMSISKMYERSLGILGDSL